MHTTKITFQCHKNIWAHISNNGITYACLQSKHTVLAINHQPCTGSCGVDSSVRTLSTVAISPDVILNKLTAWWDGIPLKNKLSWICLNEMDVSWWWIRIYTDTSDKKKAYPLLDYYNIIPVVIISRVDPMTLMLPSLPLSWMQLILLPSSSLLTATESCEV